MALLEATFKVIENKTITEENINIFKNNLDQHEQYVKHLEESLEQTQCIFNENAGILEVNNLSKNAFNENFKESKALCGLIYRYVQQIEENLLTLMQRENALKDLCAVINEDIKKKDISFSKVLKTIELKEKNICEKFLEEHEKLENQINALHMELKNCEESCETLSDLHHEKKETLHSLKVECELLEGNLESENAEMEKILQDEKDCTKKIFDIIKSNNDMKDKICFTEESVLASLEKLKELMDEKTELLKKQPELINNLQQIEEQCSAFETQLREIQDCNNISRESLTNKCDTKRKQLKALESEMLSYENQKYEIDKELQQITALYVAVNERLASLQSTIMFNENNIRESNNFEKLDKEYEILIKNSEMLLSSTNETNNKICEKRSELALLKINPHLELGEIKDKLQALESDIQNNHVQKEIEEIELRNKNFQKNIEHLESTMKELTFENFKYDLERNSSVERLKVLTQKFDNMKNEIHRLEIAKQEKIKLFPKPTLKRNSSKVQDIPPPKRRSFVNDFESDSSVDGEKLSYAEFMAKKKTQIKRRHIRMNTSSDNLKHA